MLIVILWEQKREFKERFGNNICGGFIVGSGLRFRLAVRKQGFCPVFPTSRSLYYLGMPVFECSSDAVSVCD
jgi:hypothetical protein